MKWLSRLFIIGLLVFSPLVGRGACEFNLSDGEYISLGNTVNVTQVTVSAWVKINSKTTSPDFHPICGKGDHQYMLRYHYNSGTDRFEFFTHDGSWHEADGTISPTIGEWYHVCGTCNGSTVRIYVNGNEEDSLSGGITTSTANLEIGRNSENTDRLFNGTITEVAIWDVALTADEIKLLANPRLKGMPLQIQPSHLKLYLPLDDHPDGTTNGSFKDLSSNGNDGTGYNGVTSRGEEVLSYPQEMINWQ